MDTLRRIGVALAVAVCFAVTMAQSWGADDATSPSTSQETIQNLRARVDLFQLELDLWKEKFEQLNARYRSLRLEQLVRELEKEVSDMRGLPLRHGVEYRMIKPGEVAALLERKLDETYPPEKMHYFSLALKLLGFINEDVDMRKIMLDLYTEQLAGLYDESTHILYVVELFDLEKSLTRVILAHEICHALQDQNFSFADLPLHIEDNDDLQLAIMAVIEGDATMFTFDYMQRLSPLSVLMEIPALLAINNTKLNSAPYSLQQILLFPYMQGSVFVQTVISRQDDEARDRLFRDYPRSSAQILHPDEYLSSREDPTTVTLPELRPFLSKDWHLAFSNVMGEFAIQILFATHLESWQSSSAAAGWKGDRIHLYADTKDGYGLFWGSIWETEDDAQEFADALKTLLPRVHGPARLTRKKGTIFSCQFERRHTWATIRHSGKQVTLFLSSFEPRGKLVQTITRPLNIPEHR